MRALTKRENIILCACLGLVSVFAMLKGVIQPARGIIDDIDADIARQERIYQKRLRAISKASRSYKKHGTIIKRHSQRESDEQIMASMLSDIEQAAKKMSMPIANIKPNKVSAQGPINRFSVTLSLNSNFMEVFKFIYMLQNGPHYFNIEDLQFDQGIRGRNAMKATLTLRKAYIQPI